MDKKRIALCFSGALRTFPYCVDSIVNNIIEQLKQHHNINIFGSFWKIDNRDCIKELEFTMKLRTDDEKAYKCLDKIQFDKLILEEYDDKKEKEIINFYNGQYILDKYKEEQNQDKINYAFNCMAMNYKIYKANQLKCEYETENNMKFDYVIRMRPDFYWYESIDINILNNLDDKKIFTVFDSYCKNANWQGNDKFYGLTSDNMDYYVDIRNYIHEMFENNIQIEGQYVARYGIQKLKLELLFFGSPDTYDKVNGKITRKLIKNKIVQI